jgi:hypothetical protein
MAHQPHILAPVFPVIISFRLQSAIKYFSQVTFCVSIPYYLHINILLSEHAQNRLILYTEKVKKCEKHRISEKLSGVLCGWEADGCINFDRTTQQRIHLYTRQSFLKGIMPLLISRNVWFRRQWVSAEAGVLIIGHFFLLEHLSVTSPL